LGKNFIGSVFVVAGCSMGAGCLALPMLAAGPDFIFSSIFIILIAILSYFIASVSLEVFLYYKYDVNTSTVIVDNFGKPGWVISGVINLVIMYSLLSVYMSGSVDLLSKLVFPLMHLNISSPQALLIFLLIILPLFFRGADVVVKSNKIVFFIKLICFIIVLLMGLSFTSSRITEFSFAHIRYVPKALPIFFVSLWFHFLIPIIARINNYDRRECHKVFIVGLAIPALLYICWILVMLSLVPRSGDGHTFFSILKNNDSVGTMISYAAYNNQRLPGAMKVGLNFFSNIAMITSFLTVGLSNYDYIRDAFKIKQTKMGTVLNVFLTMIPPALLALLWPNAFVGLLQQIAIMVMLVNIMVLSCAYKMRDSLLEKQNKYKILIILFILGLLITVQVLDDFNFLSSFGIN
jgi:tyrosine-specific transport protein